MNALHPSSHEPKPENPKSQKALNPKPQKTLNALNFLGFWQVQNELDALKRKMRGTPAPLSKHVGLGVWRFGVGGLGVLGF